MFTARYGMVIYIEYRRISTLKVLKINCNILHPEATNTAIVRDAVTRYHINAIP